MPASLRPDLESALCEAVRAPSLHNTQPWQFRITGREIELLLDPSRVLPATDPDGREAIISCGAALFGLRLALGLDAAYRLCPDRSNRLLLARLTIPADHVGTEYEHDLRQQVTRRHTHRGSFYAHDVQMPVLVALQQAAWDEGATLHLVTQPGRRASLARIAGLADEAQRRDPEYRRELAEWAGSRSMISGDGVPEAAFADHGAAVVPVEFPARRFGVGARRGSLPPGHEAPDIGVLTTRHDTTADRLRAGQALYRLLLEASRHWVFASYATSAIEQPPYRRMVAEALSLAEFPQMMLRLGYAFAAPLTPRRPVTDVLLPSS